MGNPSFSDQFKRDAVSIKTAAAQSPDRRLAYLVRILLRFSKNQA